VDPVVALASRQLIIADGEYEMPFYRFIQNITKQHSFCDFIPEPTQKNQREPIAAAMQESLLSTGESLDKPRDLIIEY